MSRRIIGGLICLAFVIQLMQIGEPLKVQAVSQVNTPAEFAIPGDVKTAGIEPIGANLTSITGANNFAINNEASGSGFEPVVMRQLERATRVGPNWFEWDGHGGVSAWAQKWTGFGNGAEVRFYRLEDPNGSPLPYTNGNLEVTNANHFSLIGTASVPTPNVEFPLGGYVCNKYTTTGSTVRYNNFYTNALNVTNGKTYYYVVQAIDAKGNKSVNSNEVSVVPQVGLDNGPHIYSENPQLPVAKAATAYSTTLTATGGTTPYRWEIVQGALPTPLILNSTTGVISGTPATAPPETTLKIKVTDAIGRSDIRDYKLNPVADVVDNNDAISPNAPTNVTATANDGSVTLQWTASNSSDVVSYQVYVSDVPEAQQLARVYVDKSNLDLKQGDYAFIYKKTNSMPNDVISLRLNPLLYGGGDVFSYDKKLASFNRVAHPGTIPSNFNEKGETCLEVTAKTGTISLGQTKYYPFITGNTESQWYTQLKPGQPYKVEVWMRQDGLADSGKVKFEFNGGNNAYSSISQVTPWTVTSEWQKYTYEFVGPAYPVSGNHITFGFKFTGPGKLYLDNFLVYRNDAFHEYKPFTPHEVGFTELMDSMPATGKKPSIRFYATSFQDSSMDAMTSNYSNSTFAASWAPSIGAGTKITIAQSMIFAFKTGTSPENRVVPYLTVPVDYYESEWKALIEYLGDPYNPATDTPQSKPYAYKRYVQRGNNGTPWTEEFREIVIELGNETWHNGAVLDWDGFGAPSAVTQGGKEYGIFSKYIFNDVIGQMSSWYANNMNSKIKFSLGAFYNAAQDSYGELATQQGGNISYLGHANYVGPKWETGDVGFSTFDDHGIQESLIGFQTNMKTLIDETANMRDYLNTTKGTNYQLQAYEGGPSGYDVNIVTDTSENYGKSEANGLAALDAWLYSSYVGYKYQNYLGYGSGNKWTSHTVPEAGGFIPHAGWLALKMRNKSVLGDKMLTTVDISNPTYDRFGTDIPLTGVYAMKDDSNNYYVFVLNRKLAGVHDGVDFGDGYTPVKIRLPFTNPSSIELHKLAHPDGTPVDPAENNRTTQKIKIVSQSIDPQNYSNVFEINQNTGGDARGIPEGGVYLYVFHDTTPAAIVTPDPTSTPTPIPSLTLLNEDYTLITGSPYSYNTAIAASGSGSDVTTNSTGFPSAAPNMSIPIYSRAGFYTNTPFGYPGLAISQPYFKPGYNNTCGRTLVGTNSDINSATFKNLGLLSSLSTNVTPITTTTMGIYGADKSVYFSNLVKLASNTDASDRYFQLSSSTGTGSMFGNQSKNSSIIGVGAFNDAAAKNASGDKLWSMRFRVLDNTGTTGAVVKDIYIPTTKLITNNEEVLVVLKVEFGDNTPVTPITTNGTYDFGLPITKSHKISLYLNPNIYSEPTVPDAVIQGADLNYRFLLKTYCVPFVKTRISESKCA